LSSVEIKKGKGGGENKQETRQLWRGGKLIIGGILQILWRLEIDDDKTKKLWGG